jgi:hypothetical protein
MRARRIGAVLGILAALLATPMASAAAATETVITIDVTFDGPEYFTATGGVICESGTATTEGFANFGGRKNRGVFTFHIVKTLTCADGSGTFKLLVDAAASRTSPGTVGGFAAGGGTGEYVGLHGGGSLVGTGFPDGTGITDVYTGMLTIAP